ncbi:MAG: tetratricopeptide repeat protein [Candidatus Marinimicrobia bacterium]|nr:tetratricopeptide repeat protein [Candidatus Neomarinimicrobiota bacterium]MCF7829213.1 tetratricopeptide repeat protein [Candidatus Neomarinimicrobiota bacterium]MCF7881134.1 tetratricopeptide repeat protein [Candidatus Neomarinimicrobiota bacterium]
MNSRRLPLLIVLLAVIAGTVFIACQSQELTSAKLYIQQENWDNAEKFLKQAEEVEPENPEVPFLLGSQVYARQEKFEQMNEAFERSLEKGDQFKEQIKNVRMKYWTQKFNSGAKTYNAAIEAQGAKRDTMLQRAINQFETAMTIMPDKPETYGSLATAYLLTGNLARAKETFETAVEKNPENFQVIFNYGRLLADEGENERALELLKKAHELEPENLQAIQLLASVYIKENKVEEALNMYNQALEQEPENPDLYFNQAILHIQLAQDYNEASDSTKADQQYKEALESMERAVELRPEDVEAQIRLGELYQEMEMWEQAADTFRAVLEKQPENIAVMKKLAITVYRMGDPQKGQEILEKAKKLEQEQAGGQ